jgi:phospholipid/cholesterol/gamma-HCH transport system substrate-binding protein
MAGISVGIVTGIHPDYQAGQVIITWKVNKGVRLGPTTTADLALQNLLGGQYIRLSGPVQPPYMEKLPAAQRRIPLERTHTSLSVNGVLSSTAADIQQINPDTVNKVLVELTGVVSGSQRTFGPLLTNLASVAGAINQRDADLRQLVSNTQQVTSTLAAKNQQLGQLIDTARGLLNELVTRRDQLSNVLGAGSDAVVQLSNLIGTERAHLRSIIDDTHVGITAASQELPQVDQGFAWTGPTFTDLGQVNSNGPVDAVLNSVTFPVAGDFLTLLERALTGKTAP